MKLARYWFDKKYEVRLLEILDRIGLLYDIKWFLDVKFGLKSKLIHTGS
jgi:hypothetical protein